MNKNCGTCIKMMMHKEEMCCSLTQQKNMQNVAGDTAYSQKFELVLSSPLPCTKALSDKWEKCTDFSEWEGKPLTGFALLTDKVKKSITSIVKS